MDTIKDVLQNVFGNLQRRRSQQAGEDPQELLKSVFSKNQQPHIKLNYLRNGTLDVLVDSSVWMYKLVQEKEGLLKKMQREITAIKDVRFHIGDIK